MLFTILLKNTTFIVKQVHLKKRWLFHSQIILYTFYLHILPTYTSAKLLTLCDCTIYFLFCFFWQMIPKIIDLEKIDKALKTRLRLSSCVHYDVIKVPTINYYRNFQQMVLLKTLLLTLLWCSQSSFILYKLVLLESLWYSLGHLQVLLHAVHRTGLLEQ